MLPMHWTAQEGHLSYVGGPRGPRSCDSGAADNPRDFPLYGAEVDVRYHHWTKREQICTLLAQCNR
jgi:hypothetical protein